MSVQTGTVYLVGAGPGDPGLITARGLALLRRADVIVHDRLIGRELLAEVRSGAEVIDVGKARGERKVKQNWINELLVDRARQGKMVVRLKGGDPFIFGRGFEELSHCRYGDIPCTVVPGVSSAIAGPTAAGIPITQRKSVRSFAVVTATTAGESETAPLDYAALAKLDLVVVLMGRENLPSVAKELLDAGRAPKTPAACVAMATTPQQRVVKATLATIADAADRAGLMAPVVTVIGDAASHAEVDGSPGAGPLHGKQIVVTRPVSRLCSFRQAIYALGGTAISCPMIRIEYPMWRRQRVLTGQPESGSLTDRDAARANARSTNGLTGPDELIRRIGDYDWIVFSSVHGVRGFWRLLSAYGLDARAFAGVHVSAVGPSTASALKHFGIKADLVPTLHTGKGLLDDLTDRINDKETRVLYPCGNLAGTLLADGLRDAGAIVDSYVVYDTVSTPPPKAAVELIQSGVDAIAFFSPSAVRAFVESGIETGPAIIACIGPTTAAAVIEAGLRPDIVAENHTAAGLAGAIADHFCTAGAIH